MYASFCQSFDKMNIIICRQISKHLELVSDCVSGGVETFFLLIFFPLKHTLAHVIAFSPRVEVTVYDTESRDIILE